ncbi:hypothetical protein V8G54_034653 [Vigna mungo]|uniref:Uncharacterized protein n=1 Tax=Vigna mungo TaxID=3915 RepID=A0AAQ3MDG6_VIGMU
MSTRLYRSGIFHFHERDLARSLLLIDCQNKSINTSKNFTEDEENNLLNIYLTATGFLYKSYLNKSEAQNDIKYLVKSELILKLPSSSFKQPLELLSNLILRAYERIIN